MKKGQGQPEAGVSDQLDELVGDLDEDARHNIARIEASPFTPHQDSVRGFVYDVSNGCLREIELPNSAEGEA
jgi:carbonic anhydrase